MTHIHLPAFFEKPSTQKTLRYMAAYGLFLVCAVLGFLIMINIRANILAVSVIAQMDEKSFYILASWGSYLIFLPYVFCIPFLEGYFNRAARDQALPRRAGKALLVELAVGGVSLLISAAAYWGYAIPLGMIY